MLSVHFSASVPSTAPMLKRDPPWDQGHAVTSGPFREKRSRSPSSTGNRYIIPKTQSFKIVQKLNDVLLVFKKMVLKKITTGGADEPKATGFP